MQPLMANTSAFPVKYRGISVGCEQVHMVTGERGFSSFGSIAMASPCCVTAMRAEIFAFYFCKCLLILKNHENYVPGSFIHIQSILRVLN